MLKLLQDGLKHDFDDCKMNFFQLKESFRFLISKCYFAHVDSVSAENMISDLLGLEISI